MCHVFFVANHSGSPGVEMVWVVVAADGSVAKASAGVHWKLLAEKTVWGCGGKVMREKEALQFHGKQSAYNNCEQNSSPP